MTEAKERIKSWFFHNIIYIAFSLCALTILCFLYKQHPNFSVTINTNWFSALATCIAAITTSATFILLYRQLAEMRKVASHPDLYPADATFFCHDGTMPMFSTSSQGITPIRFSLYNIGLGAAKEITYKWVYSDQEVKAFVKNRYEYIHVVEQVHKLNFLVAKDTTQIHLPQYYMMCCGSLCNFNGADLFNEEERIAKPTLRLQINYKDIFDKNIPKMFAVSIEDNNQQIDFKFITM